MKKQIINLKGARPLFSISKRCLAPFGFAVLISFVIATSSVFALTPAEQESFKKANQFYREGKFRDAAAAYRELASKYPSTAVFQYNLGNSYYRSGNLGPAILAYERAKRLAPRDEDVRYNLSYVKSSLEYKIEDKRNSLLPLMEGLLGFFKDREAALLGLVFYFLLAAGLVFSLFTGRGMIWGAGRQFLFVMISIALLLWGAKMIQRHFFPDAVVMQKEAPVRYGPSENDKTVLQLGEGLKVYVLDRRDDWSRIFVVNGESGWIKNAHIAEV
jgi:tetratricopeptide (TPR) repeat protein